MQCPEEKQDSNSNGMDSRALVLTTVGSLAPGPKISGLVLHSVVWEKAHSERLNCNLSYLTAGGSITFLDAVFSIANGDNRAALRSKCVMCYFFTTSSAVWENYYLHFSCSNNLHKKGKKDYRHKEVN